MSDSLERDALAYLLHEMNAAQRAAFEREVARDPAASAALKATADALAGFACELGPAEPLGARDHGAVLEHLRTHVAIMGAPPRARSMRLRWPRLLWPLAAALLLGLNLFDFRRPLVPPPTFVADRPDSPRDRTAGSPSEGTRKNFAPSATTPETSPQPKDPGAPSTRDSQLAADERLREIERLRANVADLERAHQRLSERYDSLVERTASLGVIERELNRLSTMELVDSGSHARGERKGLVSLGRSILTEPGVVIPPDSPGQPPPGQASQTARQPYAWSVFDEKELRGYLNFYNLPTVGAEEAFHVWVRAADAPGYQRVAEVIAPPASGNGSLQYNLPGATAAPSEILITVEPRGAPPTLPTGRAVLRGP